MAEDTQAEVEAAPVAQAEPEPTEANIEIPTGMYVEDTPVATEETPAAPVVETAKPAEPKPDAEKVNPEKKLEQMGYQISNVVKTVDRLEALITAQGGKATPAQAKQLVAAADKVADMGTDLADGDFVEGAAIKKIIAAQNATIAELRAEIRQTSGAVSETKWTQDFYRDNPELNGKIPDLRTAVEARLAAEIPDVTDHAERAGYARAVWNQEVAKAKATATPGTKPAAPKPNVVSRPAGTPAKTPTSTPAPTRVTQQGASINPATASAEREFDERGQAIMPRGMWKPDA